MPHFSSDCTNSGIDYLRAHRAVERQIARDGACSPLACITSVCRVLPRSRAMGLYRFIRSHGWHRSSNRVSQSNFDHEIAKVSMIGGSQALLRLAVFGLPGQGKMTDQKHRDALFQRFSAEIMRESHDMARLDRTASRVLGHRDVCADALLLGMLRAVVAQRKAELEMQSSISQAADQPSTGYGANSGSAAFFTKEQVLGMLQRLAHKFEDQIAHYEELAADESLTQIKNLATRYPVHIDAEVPARFEAAFERFRERCATWRKTIGDLASKGVEAATQGDEHKAAWIIRRLHAIHATRTALLHEVRLEEMCREIQRAEDTYEEQEAAAHLIAREKEIAREVKTLAAAIRQFHTVAREQGPGSSAYRVAVERYRKAVQDVVSHDQDWLTGVFIELEDMVCEMHDETGHAEKQINEFINRVRTAILEMREEIRQIHAEKLDEFPSTGNADA